MSGKNRTSIQKRQRDIVFEDHLRVDLAGMILQNVQSGERSGISPKRIIRKACLTQLV